MKKYANWNSHDASSSILLLHQGAVRFFIKHFLISPILYEGTRLIRISVLRGITKI